MDATTISILQDLVTLPWLHVAFLIDERGRLLGSAGSSPAFSHSGHFRNIPPEAIDEPDTSLYITAVTRDVYLGVLYASEVEIEAVRAEVTHRESHLASALTS